MDRLTQHDFRQLAEISESWCVTLQLPTYASGQETRQNPIRFKNLLEQAEEGLVARGQRSADARGQLQPLGDLLEDAVFWTHQRQGLAAFSTPQGTRVFGVPFELPERAVVSQHCHLVPLIPIVSRDARFYVLAISPKAVRLLEGTHYSAEELELPGWPEKFEELAAFIEEQPQLQYHTEAQPVGTSSDRAAVYHGQPGGEADKVRKQRLLEYCRLVDGRVREVIGEDGPRLVLACDKRLAPIYHEASEYSNIEEEPVAGNPDERRVEDLCQDAWPIVRPALDAARQAALSRHDEAAGHGLAAIDLAAVLRTVNEGRVGALFVNPERQRWGKFDPDQPRLDVHDERLADDDDLVNEAVVRAFNRSAELYCVSQERLPGEEPAKATLRY